MHILDTYDKIFIMHRTYIWVLIYLSLIICGCSSKTIIQDFGSPHDESNEFYAFLDLFETIYPTDTMMDLTEKLTMTDPFHFNEIDSEMIKYVLPIPPFFKVGPAIKIKCKEGWCVFLVHQYEVANIELKYIDIISYDLEGKIVSRLNLPYTDGHGGLYYDLDERYVSQGEIAISSENMEYTWYYKFNNKDLSDTLSFRYKILSDGSMVQIAF